MCCSFISEPQHGQAFGVGFSGTAVSNEKKIRLTAADELRRPDRFLPSARVRLYLADHEGGILLHKAAKKAFDELGVRKLPSGRRNTPSCYRRKRRRMPNTGVRATRCASCCSTSRTWIVCWAKTSTRRRRKRSMTGNNGHSPRRFAETCSAHFARSRGLRGAAPTSRGEFSRRRKFPQNAKESPLCPACHVCYVCKFGLKITLLS